MKLVNYEEFCRMPAGTIFAPYTPCILEEELAIKTDAGDKDGRFNGVMPLEPWIDSDTGLRKVGDSADLSLEVYDGSNADYLDYELFLILEESDIDRLIEALTWAKNGCVVKYIDAIDMNVTKHPWNSVHCEDCGYYKYGTNANGDIRHFCEIPGRMPVFKEPDDFCPYGWRRDS